MRLAALVAATFPLTAIPALADNVRVISVTAVSYSLPADPQGALSPRGFPTDGYRAGPFEMGTPEGSGYHGQPVRPVAARAVVRLADRRAKKAFGIPWQTGIFQ
jgi:hypothetical protein